MGLVSGNARFRDGECWCDFIVSLSQSGLARQLFLPRVGAMARLTHNDLSMAPASLMTTGEAPRAAEPDRIATARLPDRAQRA